MSPHRREFICSFKHLGPPPSALLILWLYPVIALKIWLQQIKNSTFHCSSTSDAHLHVVPVADPHAILTISLHFTVLAGVYTRIRILPLHVCILSYRTICLCVLHVNKNVFTNMSRIYRMGYFIKVIRTVQLQDTVTEIEICQSNKRVTCHCCINKHFPKTGASIQYVLGEVFLLCQL
jgi:hypothetical protein